jgi:hypothetical protein
MESVDLDKSVPTWKWVVGVLAILVLSAWGLIIQDTFAKIRDVDRSAVEARVKAELLYGENRARIEGLQDKKLDKEQYYKDLADIKDILKGISNKLDRHMVTR